MDKKFDGTGRLAGRPFSLNVFDYQPMCPGCHKWYDTGVPWRSRSRAIEGVKAKILSGEFAPGTKLPGVDRLAKSFGVSRTTAHKAVKILGYMGFVSLVNYRYIVSDASAREGRVDG